MSRNSSHRQPSVAFLVEPSYVNPRTHSQTPINKHGGTILFPPELRRRGWTELHLVPSTPMLLVCLALIALPIACFPQRKHQTPINRDVRRLRCMAVPMLLLLDAILLSSLLPQAMQQLRPALSHKSSSRADVPSWRVLPKFDVVLVLLSPGAPARPPFLQGLSCVLLNHAEGEDAFLKHTFAMNIRRWSAERSCDYTRILPPTFFPTPPVELNAADDCAQLFQSSRLAHRTAAVRAIS